jgi:hypothetical protein
MQLYVVRDGHLRLVETESSRGAVCLDGKTQGWTEFWIRDRRVRLAAGIGYSSVKPWNVRCSDAHT